MYSFDGRIRYSEVDRDGSLTMGALLNYFQDCSTFQSEDLGIGIEYLAGKHMIWVLSSWQIVVERYPKLGEEVQIGTLPYEIKSFMGHRNFFMRTKSGEWLAKANTLWSLLDTDNWKPVLPTQEILDAYGLEEKLDMEYASRKIAVPEGGEFYDEVVIKSHHLDTNNHVNNGQYVNIALEYLPEDFAIRQLRAEYKQQTLLNDVLIPYVARQDEKVIVSLNDETGKARTVVEFAGTRKA